MENYTVSIYPSAGGRYLASYLHPLSKKRIRLHFDTKKEAEAYRKQIEDRFTKGMTGDFKELQVDDLLIYYMREYPKSDFALAKRYTTDFSDTFGKFKITEVTSEDLRNWLDLIQRENKLKDISIRGVKCIIDTFFNFLVQKEVISESPLTTIYFKKPAPEVSARNILSKSQIDDLLAKAKTYSPGYLYPIVKIFTETAAKPSEIIELGWRQINLEAGEVYFPRTPKSQERTLKISEELTSYFEKKQKIGGFVFMTYYKEPFTSTKLSRLLGEFKLKGNCSIRWTPMDLRHSYAVNFLKAGGDIRKLQHVLGHENVFD